MKEQLSITIEGKNYPIKFDFGSIFILDKIWNTDRSYNKMQEKIKDSFSLKNLKYTAFETFIAFGEIVFAGIKNYDVDASITVDEVTNAVFILDSTNRDILFDAFANSLPILKNNKSANQTFYNSKQNMC